MATPDLIFRQKHPTMNVAINVKTMLAGFLSFVTSKIYAQSRIFGVLPNAMASACR